MSRNSEKRTEGPLKSAHLCQSKRRSINAPPSLVDSLIELPQQSPFTKPLLSSCHPSSRSSMVAKLRGSYATVGVTIMAGFGWILFGYDLGVLGGVLNEADFASTFPMDATITGLVTGVFELAAMFGALGMAAFGQVLSRADNTMIGTGIIGVGAIIQASSTTLAQLIIGRIVGGVGLGIFTSVCPIWQAEVTPPNRRGRVIGLSLSFLIVGLMLSYWIDYGMVRYAGSVSWRFPFAFQCVLAVCNMVLTRVVPESPRWLCTKGRLGEARTALCLLSGRFIFPALFWWLSAAGNRRRRTLCTGLLVEGVQEWLDRVWNGSMGIVMNEGQIAAGRCVGAEEKEC